MTRQAKGTVTVNAVRCGSCGELCAFHPSHETVQRARIHLRFIYWSFDGRGWICPVCLRSERKRGRRGRFERPQITLPGFGKVGK